MGLDSEILSSRISLKEGSKLSQNYVIYLARETITVILLVGGPILLTALLVGLLVSTLQAMTQIQEQTLTFIPKLIAIGVVLVILGPWMLQTMVGYTHNLLDNLDKFANF